MLPRWLLIGVALSLWPAAAAARVPRRAAASPAPHPDSVGHPNDGRLVGGARLDTSKPYLRVVPVYATSDVRWGLPALTAMLDRAARGVARRFPGAVLDVGDLSRRDGGEIDHHHSHESGRDADLGFYVVDAKGKPVQARRFVRVDETLRSTTVRGGRFDVARNWALVELMLTDPRAQLSHVFIADYLRTALLAHARSRKVSAALLNRAALVLMQPTAGLPHDDHMHVRISCPRDSRDRCVELSKNAPRGGRVARARHFGGQARTVARRRVSD